MSATVSRNEKMSKWKLARSKMQATLRLKNSMNQDHEGKPAWYRPLERQLLKKKEEEELMKLSADGSSPPNAPRARRSPPATTLGRPAHPHPSSGTEAATAANAGEGGAAADQGADGLRYLGEDEEDMEAEMVRQMVSVLSAVHKKIDRLEGCLIKGISRSEPAKLGMKSSGRDRGGGDSNALLPSSSSWGSPSTGTVSPLGGVAPSVGRQHSGSFSNLEEDLEENFEDFDDEDLDLSELGPTIMRRRSSIEGISTPVRRRSSVGGSASRRPSAVEETTSHGRLSDKFPRRQLQGQGQGQGQGQEKGGAKGGEIGQQKVEGGALLSYCRAPASGTQFSRLLASNHHLQAAAALRSKNSQRDSAEAQNPRNAQGTGALTSAPSRVPSSAPLLSSSHSTASYPRYRPKGKGGGSDFRQEKGIYWPSLGDMMPVPT